MSLKDKRNYVVNCAKSWFRATPENVDLREHKLRGAVEGLLKAEHEVKAKKTALGEFHDAAQRGMWRDAEGTETPYTKMEDSHLYHVRVMLTGKLDHPHYDNLCVEIERRVELIQPILKEKVAWAKGIPFMHETTTLHGEEYKVTYRNFLTKKREHVEVQRNGTLVAWSNFRGHGLKREHAIELARHFWQNHQPQDTAV